MKIIFAQGNPGVEYAKTRHNVGFMALDTLAEQHHAIFAHKPKFFADIAEVNHNGDKVLLVKPQTYYNDTGKSARALLDFYKIPSVNLLVLHDELALPFGTLRTREKGSDAGNNGIKSLNAHVGQDFGRVRIGIYTDMTDVMGATDFVLGQFTRDELHELSETILPKTAEIIDAFAADSHINTSFTL